MAKKNLLRMRRLLSGVLSAVMLATLVPSTAFRNRKDGYRLLPDGSVPDDPENKRHGCRLGTG